MASDWLIRALSENGEPSSQRLLAFIATSILSGIAIVLAVSLIDNPAEDNLSTALVNICYALAGLGGFTYVGSGVAKAKYNRRSKYDQPYSD